jgi:hypothetical protein
MMISQGYYDEVLQTIEDPDVILRGHGGALIAVRALGRRKYLAVVLIREKGSIRYYGKPGVDRLIRLTIMELRKYLQEPAMLF